MLPGADEAGGDPEALRRATFLVSVTGVALAVLVPLGGLALYEGSRLLGALDLALAALLGVNLWAARARASFEGAIALGVAAAGALFLFTLLTGGANRSAVVWFLTFPLLATFGLGARAGARWSLSLLAPALAFLAWPHPPPPLAEYDPDLRLRLVPAYLVVLAFSYLAERSRERGVASLRALSGDLERRVDERTAELAAANADLEEEIRERRRAERLLGASEERHRRLVEGANAVILEWDAAGAVTFINPYGERFFGFPAREIVGRNVVGTIVPETESSGRDLALLMEEIRADPDRFRDNENENVTRDGRRVWVRWSNKAIVDGEGPPRGVLSVGIDITRRKRAEESLRRSEELIRSVIDTVDEGFLVLGPDFLVRTANRAFCAGAGVAEREVLGRPCWQVTHGSDRPCHEAGEDCPAQRALVTGRPHASVHSHRLGGREAAVQVKAFPLLDEGGAVTAVIETHNDLTERRLLEESRLRAQKLEAVGTLAGGIAHDFNNLLQGIFGYIGVARARLAEGSEAAEILGKAERAIDAAVGLTGQLLTLSKGGRPLKRPVALGPVVEGAARLALSGSSVDAVVEIAEDLPPVEADRGQIGQVVQNLVLNAVQAMPRGGTVRVAARRVPAAAGSGRADAPGVVEITVSDTGAGIPSELLPRVFDPYFTTKELGSGLGLATSDSIVRSHGGELGAVSVPGRGSVFTVRLPAAAAEGAPPAGGPSPAATGGGQSRRLRVLLMDDEQVVRDAAEAMLRQLGHEAVCVGDGAAAVAAYREALASGRPHDVVVLDLTVRGGMGGEEAVAALRELDPGVRAVVASGYSKGPVLAEFTAHGFAARLPKPYGIAQLRDALAAAAPSR